MGYWKGKILPMFKMVFDRNAGKRTAAGEACKSFEGAKDSYDTEFEAKKEELQPKVLQIFRDSSEDMKNFVKDPTETGLKKNSAALNSFLEQLVKIDFPGSQAAWDASSTYGASHVVEPILYVFKKVSPLVIAEEKEGSAEGKAEEAGSGGEREIPSEEGKKEEKEPAGEKTEDKEKSLEAAVVAPAQDEGKPVELAAAPPPTQVEGKPAESAASTTQEGKPAESSPEVAKPSEPAVSSSSNEPVKKEEANPATTAISH